MKTGGYHILNIVFIIVMKIIANPSVFIPSRIAVIDNNTTNFVMKYTVIPQDLAI